MNSKRGTKTPLGRTPLRALATPLRLGSPRRAGIQFSLLRNHASQARRPRSGRAPRAHPPSPGERTPARARAPPRPRTPATGRRLAEGWPAQPGRSGRGAARAGEGGGGTALPRAPPPARLHRGAPTCPARLLQRSGQSAPLRADQRGGGSSFSLPEQRALDTLQPLAHHRPLGASLALPQ